MGRVACKRKGADQGSAQMGARAPVRPVFVIVTLLAGQASPDYTTGREKYKKLIFTKEV